MTELIQERLLGCNADTLDSYLRGLGFFLLAGEIEPDVRAWWDDDRVLWLVSSGLDLLAGRVGDRIRAEDLPPIRTPWRGAQGRDTDFVAIRNESNEPDIAWFDACCLSRPIDVAGVSEDDLNSERSDRENNPLLGQGGAFGRSDTEAAWKDAVARLSKLPEESLNKGLVAGLTSRPLDVSLSQKLATTRAVLGAYQSGRATGAGLSTHDVEATKQKSRSSSWDVVLVLVALSAFRGAPTRRADPRARAQASFPFVVRSKPIGAGSGTSREFRRDDDRTFELLAPLWSVPCSARSLRHLIVAGRLRGPRGVAQDTLDGALIQASRAAHGLGFDRLVRFSFVPASDPRYRYAVRRGDLRASATAAAWRALEEIVPFLRELDRRAHEESPSLFAARRQLETALALFGRPDAQSSPARKVQEALIALALVQAPAGRAVARSGGAARGPLRSPRLSSMWFRLADDGSPTYRLARSLVTRWTSVGDSPLRHVLLPHALVEGQWVIDATASPPDLARAGDPLASLVRVCLTALRRTQHDDLVGLGAVGFDDVEALLSGSLDTTGERRLALLTAALAEVRPAEPPPIRPGHPLQAGIGTDVARLLLAAQPADSDKGARPSLERSVALSSMLLAGRIDAARIAADRELRRRDLDLLDSPPLRSHVERPTHLALAVLLPFDAEGRARLARVVSSTPDVPGGQT